MYFILDCHSRDAWIMLGKAYVHRCNSVVLQLQARSYLPTVLLVLKIPGIARDFCFLKWNITLAHGERKRLEYFNPMYF